MSLTSRVQQPTSRGTVFRSGPPSIAGDVTTAAPVPTPSRRIDADRLCAAARSLLDQVPGLSGEGLSPIAVEQLTRHAQALIDLHGLRGRPLAAMRAHALAVHHALTLVAGDRLRTLATGFEEGLGSR